MSNDLERIADWWTGLDAEHRDEAAAVGERLPTWMAISLANHGVELTAADVAVGQSEPLEFSTPTAFREFIRNNPHR